MRKVKQGEREACTNQTAENTQKAKCDLRRQRRITQASNKVSHENRHTSGKSDGMDESVIITPKAFDDIGEGKTASGRQKKNRCDENLEAT